MGKGKRERKKKIRKKIKKQIPKIKLKKKKATIISKEKKQTKGNGLFQPFFKAFENFKKKQKIESFKQIKFGGKERERQIKEEQKNTGLKVKIRSSGLIDINRTIHPKATKYTFFQSAHNIL